VPLLGDLDRPRDDRGRGVVDVLDGGAVEDEPAHGGAMADEFLEIRGEPRRVGVVQARAEPVDHDSVFGARARPDRDRLPVPGL